MASIGPLGDTVAVSSATLTDPTIIRGSIKDASSVSADRLDISGSADIQGAVTIGNSLNVLGSVVGSGPYMDSSDRRLKTDVKDVTGALDMVASMKPVSIHACMYVCTACMFVCVCVYTMKVIAMMLLLLLVILQIANVTYTRFVLFSWSPVPFFFSTLPCHCR